MMIKLMTDLLLMMIIIGLFNLILRNPKRFMFNVELELLLLIFCFNFNTECKHASHTADVILIIISEMSLFAGNPKELVL